MKKAIASVGWTDTKKLADKVAYTPGFSDNVEDIKDWLDAAIKELNESSKNGVSARLKELMLNESEVAIKHFAINESAIVLPNGNITYTVDGGRTWNVKRK